MCIEDNTKNFKKMMLRGGRRIGLGQDPRTVSRPQRIDLTTLPPKGSWVSIEDSLRETSSK